VLVFQVALVLWLLTREISSAARQELAELVSLLTLALRSDQPNPLAAQLLFGDAELGIVRDLLAQL
jgi:hypothetical protein